MQDQPKGGLLQTFLEANWPCAAIGIFIEHLPYARHLIFIILNPQKTLSSTHTFKRQLILCASCSEPCSQLGSLN